MIKMLARIKIHDNGRVTASVNSIKGMSLQRPPETKQEKATYAFLQLFGQFLTQINGEGREKVNEMGSAIQDKEGGLPRMDGEASRG